MAKTTASPWKKLLGDLQKLVRDLEADLRARSEQVAPVRERLRRRWDDARKANRTTATYESWRDEVLTQIAVAWVLACVFVRHLEDNDLVAEVSLAGEGSRLQEAFEAHDAFFQKHPTDTDREYLHDVFRRISALPAMDALLGEGHNPLWDVDFGPDGKPLPLGEENLSLSGDAAKRLLEFWQQRDTTTGKLLRVFRSQTAAAPSANGDGSGNDAGALDTRFLGDLYQDLSEAARKRFALLQTPDFVEEFILDRTLEPAIAEFGLDTARMIDPTCGSGHFLLGGFHRYLGHWMKLEPGTNVKQLAQRALDAVHGVDLNPFAVAIARYRLLVAALGVCGIRRLKDAPGFRIHVASGDSLLHGRRHDRYGQMIIYHEDWLPEPYAVGDFREASRILGQQYHAVVGNPPYITDKDECHREVVRKAYTSCYMKFSLGVPFTERFFALAENQTASQSAGFVGLITTNSFMKREFGKALIEKVVPELDLTHVLDTSGAYIPGHGTPTVILFGKNRHPSGNMVRAALGIRGEPGTPEDPAQGVVWQSVVRMLDTPGQGNEFITIADVEREKLHHHPWSLGGGGAADLKAAIEAESAPLASCGAGIGVGAVTGEDDMFSGTMECMKRRGIPDAGIRPFVTGERIRDWAISDPATALWPYTNDGSKVSPPSVRAHRYLWPYRTGLAGRVYFGKTQGERGLEWHEYAILVGERFRTPLSITFAEVSTHNHFVLDRGGKVFKQTAPVIKLPPGSTEDDHLLLLGLLNSSVACFWLKQSCFVKAGAGDGSQAHSDPAYFRYAFNATSLQKFPVPPQSIHCLGLATRLDALGQDVTRTEAALYGDLPLKRDEIERRRQKHEQAICHMVALQEELDWLCYALYGMLNESLVYPNPDDVPPMRHGERAFEIAMARKGADPSWFERHGSTPRTDLPAHWPAEYAQLVERRLRLIADEPFITLLEQPEHKRRWQLESWSSMEERVLKSWLLDRLETQRYWPDLSLTTCAQLADAARRDADFMQVAALYRGREDFDLTTLVTELVLSEGVPYLPKLRYTPSGLEKHKQWEETWALQRREDAGEKLPSAIPVPPKYTNTDFQRGEYWRLRGKLDVPKERFILYPGAERESDPTPVLGWAGWDHLQQAQALATYYLQCKDEEGWPSERLRPLLEGLADLVPWLLQWHNDIDPDTGECLGTFYQGFVDEQVRTLERPLTPA